MVGISKYFLDGKIPRTDSNGVNRPKNVRKKRKKRKKQHPKGEESRK
jgi:hypothetical protein